MVRAGDRQLAQEIGIDPVAGCQFRGVGTAVDCLDRHALHQRADVQATDLDPFACEQIAQHPAAGERIRQVKFVDPAHQRKIGAGCGARPVIDAAPADPEFPGSL